MTASIGTTERIRELNDAFRKSGPSAGHWMITSGVLALGEEFVTRAATAVQRFTGFSTDNDPYGEHDFAEFQLAEERLFWKIDHNDCELLYVSGDPDSPVTSRRVMTIMLASEY